MTPARLDADDANTTYALFAIFDHAWSARVALRDGDHDGARAAIFALVLLEPSSSEKRVRARVEEARRKAVVELSEQFGALFRRAA
ncbi:MAG: hypothetical protein CTY36_00230 [Methylocystis sp.]|nr:MAG: hypothetical protein CTY36_00230 [Methylocystis sp.]